MIIGEDHRGEDPSFSRTEVFTMIYELRVYQPVPGQMPKLLARFRDKLLPIWERHGIRPIGFWTTLVGESSNELTYILPWESLADRETRWTAFQNDPAWHNVRDDSERDGPIVASISNQILTPTPFSALK
jgi:NIPSNAP